LSGAEAMVLTHRLRAVHAAILVGIGTVLADDPQLTVRLVEGRNPQPLVLDSHLRLPLQASLLQGPCPPWVATLPEADPERWALLEGRGARLLPIPPDPQGRISLPALLARLADLGIDSLMVEGGASVISAFIAQGLADQVVLTIAPLFVAGLNALEGLQKAHPLPSPLRLQQVGSERLGDDWIVWGHLERREG